MKQRVCSSCGGQELRRLNRTGLWQRRVLTYFGFYPWECVFCRGRQFLRDEGKQQRRRPPIGTAA